MEEYRVVFSDKAESCLLDIAEYIARDNPQRAISFIDEMVRALRDTLSVFPHGGKRWPSSAGEVRTMPYGNYVGYYRVVNEKQRVEVLYISNAARNIERIVNAHIQDD